jgi:hypothetical protein
MVHHQRLHHGLDTDNSQISTRDLKASASQMANSNTIGLNKRLAIMPDTINYTASLLHKPNNGLHFLPHSLSHNTNSEQLTQSPIKRTLSNHRAHSRNLQLLL